MKTLRFYNRILGWVVFLVAAAVYLLTLEPTASLWDCGEFIASAYKLQVGHPPGAPLFMIMARFFSLFASNLTHVALMVNAMSGLVSALTIMFLFWTITHLGIKMFKTDEDQLKPWQIIAILGSSLVGALAYTFTDSFWFSAVEGEVYASSSLFTAMVYWAILKWENESNDKYAKRWLILIAYLMGLSIGVHLLNLLAIPAIVMVYYYKKYTFSWKGLLRALLVSVALLGAVMYGIIPGVVLLASWFELLFVNGFGLPFNSGVLFYAILLIGGLIFGILYTQKHQKVLANTILLGISVMIIGYSSFSMIVIRSHANPPMDENSPETVFSLMYYLNREQYGDRPLIMGQCFNAPRPELKEGKPTYTQVNGRYEITNRKTEAKYDKKYTMLFPRMYSSSPEHVREYLTWSGLKEKDLYHARLDENGVIKTNREGKALYDYNNPRKKPSFFANMKFFVSYQLGHMYFRYFMWNFSGRQNDEQGYGDIANGNWISGINPIDHFLVGSTKNMPKTMKEDPSRNTYYLLPFILGLIGLFNQYSRNRKDFSVVAVLFVLTGIAIVIYLNQTPLQPRERDYAYAGSFYAYAIWIGLGVLGIIDMIGKKAENVPAAAGLTAAALLLVPGIMANENWDDHDRSGRYLARDIACAYLNSCAPNAILFTGGDNDTFPLWYAQEVEGVRTDVRVVNLMLLNMDWYIDQMKVQAYKSAPTPIQIPSEKYINGTRDAIPVYERTQQAYNAREIIEFISSDQRSTKLPSQSGKDLDYVPTRSFFLPVDKQKVLANGTVKAKDSSLVVDQLDGRIQPSYLTKSNYALLDLLSNNNWERPIYFVASNSSDELGLSNYLQLEGLAYRLVPINTNTGSSFERGRIDTEILYNRLMNTFEYRGLTDKDVYIDTHHRRTLSVVRLRYRYMRLAKALMAEGDSVRAEEVMDRIMALAPNEKLGYDMFMPGLADVYFQLKRPEKGSEIMNIMMDLSDEYLTYYQGMRPAQRQSIGEEISYYIRVLYNAMQMGQQYKVPEMQTRAQELLQKHQSIAMF